jgi:hypothetical protein
MESITRNVRDIDAHARKAIERSFGLHLQENQRIVVQLVTDPMASTESETSETSKLPDWCDVFAGLTDEQIVEVETVARTRANLSRQVE